MSLIEDFLLNQKNFWMVVPWSTDQAVDAPKLVLGPADSLFEGFCFSTPVEAGDARKKFSCPTIVLQCETVWSKLSIHDDEVYLKGGVSVSWYCCAFDPWNHDGRGGTLEFLENRGRTQLRKALTILNLFDQDIPCFDFVKVGVPISRLRLFGFGALCFIGVLSAKGVVVLHGLLGNDDGVSFQTVHINRTNRALQSVLSKSDLSGLGVLMTTLSIDRPLVAQLFFT